MEQGTLFQTRSLELVERPPDNTAYKDGSYIKQHRDAWYDRGPVVAIARDLVEQAGEMISCSTLIEKKPHLRGVLEVDDVLWAITGACYKKDSLDADAVELVPADQWGGLAYTFTDVTGERLHYYYAMLVTFKGKRYVMSERRCTFVPKQE